MTTIINGSSPSITFSDGSAQTSATRPFLNRIINGAMVIDQRNAGASVTITNTSAITYVLDRWFGYGSAASKFSIQQDAGAVTPPAGFTDYLGVTSLAATSVGSSDFYFIGQYLEGFNTADLGFGTASAKTVTLSFWVRSSLTGTFGGSLENSANNRSYPFNYTISAANTWEQKSITIAGDTTGTWLTTNAIGIRLWFSLGIGSTYSGTAGAWSGADYRSATGATSVVGTNGATFYITGVQLEVGSTATSFDYRPYGTELQLCQRYYYRVNATSGYTPYGHGWNSSTSAGIVVIRHPVRMRVQPTSVDFATLSSTVLGVTESTVSGAAINSSYNGTDATGLDISSSAAFTAGFTTLTAKNSTSSYLGFSSEL